MSRIKIREIKQWGTIQWESMLYAFYGCRGLKVEAPDTPDLSNVTDMNGMFADAKYFNGDLSNWDVSNVISMQETFKNAESFNSDISGWDVSNVRFMPNLFTGASSFNQDLSSWDVDQVLFCLGFDIDTPSWVLPKPQFPINCTP